MKIGAITLSITPDLTDRLAAALEQQTRRPDFAVLVANSPRVRDRAMKQRLWDRVLYPGWNLSFSMGNNNAVREMPDDVTHLLLLNDDLIPSSTFIEQISTTTGPDITGALLVHRDYTVNHAGGIELNVDAAHGEHRARHRPASAAFAGELVTVPWVTFAAVLIKRALWNTLGGLDEGFVYGYEDHDFCLRALEIGAHIVCCGDAVAIHEECGTRPRGSVRDAQNYELFRSRWAGAPMRAVLAQYLAAHPEAEGIPE